MTLYRDWHNFTIYPDFERVISEAQRLDTSQAIRFKPNTPSELLRYSEEEVAQRGVLEIEEDFVEPGDKFVAMQVLPRGHVTIWTTKYVYEIIRDLGVEKMKRMPRYPPDHLNEIKTKSIIDKLKFVAKALKQA